MIAGVLVLEGCLQVTEQYVEYMQMGDEELRKQMETETAKTVAIDAVFFVAGKAVKYLAKKFELKIWEGWTYMGIY